MGRSTERHTSELPLRCGARTLAAVALLAIGGITAAGGITTAEEAGCMFVQAHRGFSEHYPENTLAAFRAAVDAGADRVEMDLAITRDDVVVLLHDRTLDRTTDGRGPVSSFPYDHVRGLDAGSWMDVRFAGERVPALRDVLAELADEAVLNLELKTNDRTAALAARTLDATLDLLEELDAFDRVVLSSFDALALRAAAEREPRLRTLLIDWNPPSASDGLSLAIDFGFWGWSPRAGYADAERIGRAKEAGLHVHVGASAASDLRGLAHWGVDGVSSNDTAALVAALERAGLRTPGVGCDALGTWPR
ncbi:glycerophosphodiester phosphodiesterase family protein [soil metagenome]